MDYYIYNADVYCERCTRVIQSKLDGLKRTRKKVVKTSIEDSANYPVGPYSDERSDTPEHCRRCHAFLEQPLTMDGVEYVKASHEERPTAITEMWMRFYDIRG
jgi:hypothetical protein